MASAIVKYFTHSSGVHAAWPFARHSVAKSIPLCASPTYSIYSSSAFFPLRLWSDCFRYSRIAVFAECHRFGLAATLCIATSVSLVSANHWRSASSPSSMEAI